MLTHNDRNLMLNFQPGEYIRQMFGLEEKLHGLFQYTHISIMTFPTAVIAVHW